MDTANRRRPVKWLIALLAALAVSATLVWYFFARRDAAPRYQTAALTRGDLTVTVTATGTVQPVNTVDVGTEISGTIRSVEVDYNDRVKAGQILARLDTDKLRAQVLQTESALASAQAKLAEAQATVTEARENLARFQKVRELSGGKVPSQKEYSAAEAALNRALASAATLKAQIAEARGRLSVDQTNLAKAVIRSPIDGVVLARKVEPGQTVAATLQTPVLFSIAENLAQMEVLVDVDEADVSQVAVGQPAAFTVDAYPGRSFNATVEQIRFGPETVQGVVTYKTVLSVDNSDLALRPGMTATANIIVKRLTDVLLAPNAALRFAPPTAQPAPPNGGGSFVDRLFPRPPPTRRPREPADDKQQQLWVVRDGELSPVAVTTGASNGVVTHITGGAIEAGTAVVVDAVAAPRASS